MKITIPIEIEISEDLSCKRNPWYFPSSNFSSGDVCEYKGTRHLHDAISQLAHRLSDQLNYGRLVYEITKRIEKVGSKT